MMLLNYTNPRCVDARLSYLAWILLNLGRYPRTEEFLDVGCNSSVRFIIKDRGGLPGLFLIGSFFAMGFNESAATWIHQQSDVRLPSLRSIVTGSENEVTQLSVFCLLDC
jgi:hypothetical protein